MPNYVKNLVVFDGEKDAINAMLQTIQADKLGLGSIDFNKLIPMPESLRIEAGSKTTQGLKMYEDFVEAWTRKHPITSELDLDNITESEEAEFASEFSDEDREKWALGKIAWQNQRLYGATTWYDWSINKWGTKWNACEQVIHPESETPTLEFFTAWSAPHPVFEQLAERFPDVEFEHLWADEDIGVNCGQRNYVDGEMDEYIPDDYASARHLALEIWDYEDDEDSESVLL